MQQPAPAISFLTCRWDLPQKLHKSCSLESVGRAINLLQSSTRSAFLPARRLMPSVLGDHTIDDSVLLGLLRTHEVIPFGVSPDVLQSLPGVLGDDLVQAPPYVDDLLGVNLDVSRLPLEAG